MILAQQLEQKGLQQGLQKGRQELASEIAQKMKAEGFDIQTIKKMTGLSDQELLLLKDAQIVVPI